MPSLMKYIEAINRRPIAFRTLTDLAFRYVSDGVLYKYSSSRAYVLQAKLRGKLYAVKLFVSPDASLRRRYEALNKMELECKDQFIFLEDEITIIENNRLVPQPLLLVEWIKGDTLTAVIRKMCQQNDSLALQRLQDCLLDLFIDLLSREVVHGDLKFDNIILGEDNRLHVIDWDGAYVPSLVDMPSYEVGTKGFRHPRRSVEDYGRRVDDYPIAVMIVTLWALALQPELLIRGNEQDATILNPEMLFEGRDRIYNKLMKSWRYNPLLYRLLSALSSENIEIDHLREVLIRLRRRAKFDPENEVLIDRDQPIRRILDKRSKLYGYIDRSDFVIIDTMYGDGTAFIGMIAGVRINNLWFFINRRGVQVSETFQSIREDGDDSFVVKQNNHFSTLTYDEIILKYQVVEFE